MLLAVDVGNTNIVSGVFAPDAARGSVALHSWRMATSRERTADEYGLMFQELLRHKGMELGDVTDIVAASVVPPIHPVLEACCQRYFGLSPLRVGPGVDAGLKLSIDNPGELGADRIANCVGVLEKFGSPAIVVDLGTATTFDVVGGEREYMGGLILPGVKIAAEALFQRAARLPRVELAKPGAIVGRNTVQAMQSGLFYGSIAQIDGILERLFREFPDAVAVATGGLAKVIARESIHIQHVEPDLTLNGLHAIWLWSRGRAAVTR